MLHTSRRLTGVILSSIALLTLALSLALPSRADDPPAEITNSIGIKLKLIPAGDFLMGADETQAQLEKDFGEFRKDVQVEDERPQHEVRITKPYYLGIYEVSLSEFRQFINDTDYRTQVESDGRGGFGWNKNARTGMWRKDYSWRGWGVNQSETSPVVNVTWNDCVAFCKWLSDKENARYRLPTEAEWESACRAGTSTRYYDATKPADVFRLGNLHDVTLTETCGPTRVADREGNPTGEIAKVFPGRDGFAFTAPAGRFRPNAFGLYDMLGNAWEWCADWYSKDYYKGAPDEDPQGPAKGKLRVLRGGGWTADPLDCRSACRRKMNPDHANYLTGFRLLREL